MHLAHYLGVLHTAGEAHVDEPDVFHDCERLAANVTHVERLGPFVDRYGEKAPTSPGGCPRTCSTTPAAATWASYATCTTST